MSAKRIINAPDVLVDIQAGFTNEQLRGKYRLTKRGLARIFRKLLVARLVTPDVLNNRGELLWWLTKIELRRGPRYRPQAGLTVCDLSDMTCDLGLVNMSDGGLQVTGAEARLGQIKTFLISMGREEKNGSIQFEAQCRWTEVDPRRGESRAGFQITRIDPTSRAALHRLLSAAPRVLEQ